MNFIQISERPNPGPFQWPRKLFHMLGLLIPIIYYLDLFQNFGNYTNSTRTVGFIILVFLALLAVVTDLLRFKFESFNIFIQKVLGPILKQEEYDQFNAVTPYLLSCSALILFCSKEVVAICCILLMIGDPFAAFIGSRYGRIRFWNNKSLEGILAFMFFGYIASLIFLLFPTFLAPENFFSLYSLEGNINVMLLLILFGGAFFAAIAEFFSGSAGKGLMDDNLFVPLGGALGIILIVIVFFPNDLHQFIYESLDLFATKQAPGP